MQNKEGPIIKLGNVNSIFIAMLHFLNKKKTDIGTI